MAGVGIGLGLVVTIAVIVALVYLFKKLKNNPEMKPTEEQGFKQERDMLVANQGSFNEELLEKQPKVHRT